MSREAELELELVRLRRFLKEAGIDLDSAAASASATETRHVDELTASQGETAAAISDGASARRREDRLQAILDSALDHAIITTDPQGLVTSWNVGAERILGWPPEAMLGQPAHLIFTPEDRASGAPEQEMDTARRSGRA